MKRRAGLPRAPSGPGSGPRVVRLLGHDYKVLPPTLGDPRLQVAAVLMTLQVLGQTVLNFRLSVAQILVCLATGALFEFVVGFFKDHLIMWPASGLLTGNSVAFILRVPGTLHGQWWSLHGIEIFVAVVAVSMASKYVLRWHGRHVFNPSNIGLVLAFAALGPQQSEPQDLWWIPLGPWLLLTYAVLIGGGLLIGARLRLLGMQLAFMGAFAAFLALALAPIPDHCMVASWHLAPLCGKDLWAVLVTSPELLVFALFMLPDPKTVPEGRGARIVFGASVALFAVLLLGPTTLEFWTKTAILGSLVVGCALRFPLAHLLAQPERAADLEESGRRRWRWRTFAAAEVALLSLGFLPVSADLSTRSPLPTAGLSDGSTPAIVLLVGSGPGPGTWAAGAAAEALPPVGGPAVRPVTTSVTTRLWHPPDPPPVSIPLAVSYFDPSLTPRVAAQMVRDLVLDLTIEAEARHSHDLGLAQTGAVGDGLKPFRDDINADLAAGNVVTTGYAFNRAEIAIFLPKFNTQASRLVGVSISGTATLNTFDQVGHLLSQKRLPYVRSWSLARGSPGTRQLIDNDYTDLRPAG